MTLERREVLNTQFSFVFTKENLEYIPRRMSTGIPKISNITVTEPGVTKLLRGLNENKAKGPDSVSPRLRKEVAHELSPALTFLFNQTLLTGEVPEDWKAANITPIFKKGQKNLPENYRPVSLTCILIK